MAAVVEREILHSSITPSGIEIAYGVSPKRFYLVDGVECPSVTTVLGVLDKPGLPWWGMKVGLQGVIAMHNNGRSLLIGDTLDDWVNLLTEHKLTVNHVRDKAGSRGTAVHDAFETWAKTGNLPDPDIFPDEERGYVVGLCAFLTDVNPEPLEAEVMVGSKEHGFAGRYDLRINVPEECQVVFHRTPVKGPQYATLKPGRILADLKSSKDVYMESHGRQLEAYEGASVECGYEPTSARGILNVTADGTYKFVRSRCTYDDFLNVLSVWRDNLRIKEGK